LTGLEIEMEEHLGNPKHAGEDRNGVNFRNGTRCKTVITEIGPIELDVLRDGNGSFVPATVRWNGANRPRHQALRHGPTDSPLGSHASQRASGRAASCALGQVGAVELTL